MGGEFGQGSEWSEERGLDWWLLEFDAARRASSGWYATSTGSTGTRPALWAQDTDPEGFRWIDADDAPATRSRSCATRPTGPRWRAWSTSPAVPHEDYRLGLPYGGQWAEVVNTDADAYGGSGVGNLGSVQAVEEPWHGLPDSVTLRVPPLGGSVVSR